MFRPRPYVASPAVTRPEATAAQQNKTTTAPSDATVQAGNSGLIVGKPSDPRMVGLTLRVRD